MQRSARWLQVQGVWLSLTTIHVELEETAQEMGITQEKVREIITAAQVPVSLDQPIGEKDFRLGDLVDDPEMTALPEAASLALDNLLDTLTPRERRILRLRFGVIDGQEHTPEEVGKRLGVTRERIRQIEAKALRRLCHPSRSQWLAPFLE